MLEQISVNKAVVANYPPFSPLDTRWQSWKKRAARFILVDENHPDTLKFFPSDVAVLQEKKRHYDQFPSIIHPLSKCNQIFEVFFFFFYFFTLVLKPLEFGWVATYRASLNEQDHTHLEMLFFIGFVDFFTFLTIVPQFFIGYCIPEACSVELSPKKIARRYFVKGHLVCDVLSSIPKLFTVNASDTLYYTLHSFTLLRLRRLTTFFRVIHPTFRLLKITNHTLVLLFEFFFVMTLLMHFMTCFSEGITRYRVHQLSDNELDVYYKTHYRILNLTTRYVITFFVSAQFTFLINVQEAISEHRMAEEVIFSLFNYILGKLFVITFWSVLLHSFLTRKALTIKFQEVLTEIDDYMTSKNLPKGTKRKVQAYYNYKFQKKLFNENMIKSVLSQGLEREIDVFLCQSLIRRVDIFSKLPMAVLQDLVAFLVPVVYCPNDLIIQSGTRGDYLYFIESGTVAVYTPSGKEMCHLQDGAYFGEMCVLSRTRPQTATVLAIEFTRVYKLKRKHFLGCLGNWKEIFDALLANANQRMLQINAMQEEHKKEMFQRTYVWSLK